MGPRTGKLFFILLAIMLNVIIKMSKNKVAQQFLMKYD